MWMNVCKCFRKGELIVYMYRLHFPDPVPCCYLVQCLYMGLASRECSLFALALGWVLVDIILHEHVDVRLHTPVVPDTA